MAGKPSKKSGGQVLVWPKGENEELVEKRVVPIIQDVRLNPSTALRTSFFNLTRIREGF